MKILLLTTLPNEVATTLSNQSGIDTITLDIQTIENKNDTIVRIIEKHRTDVLLTYRCPYILQDSVFNALPLGAYNIHPSLLPKYKGLNPWQEIFNKHETESGVTLHRITQDIDGGIIVSQRPFPITPSDTIWTARSKADKIASEMALEFTLSLLSTFRK